MDGTDAGRASATEAIRRTLALYCQLGDDGRFDEWIDLFTGDARFHVMGRTTTGRDAIVAFMARAQSDDKRGRHVISEPVIDVAADGRTARAATDYVFVDRGRTITSVGRYHDELVLGVDGRWRFALREIVFLGDAPELSVPAAPTVSRAQPPPG
jgi:3-phenylpropionate/cinnamic acid dioxygenase small subunit